MNKLLHRGRRLGIFVALAAGGVALPVAVAAQSSGTHSTHKSLHAATPRTSKSATNAKAGAGSRSTTKTTKSKRGAANRKSQRVKGQAAPTTERINEIQSALTKKGFYAGEPTGKWDDDSTEAMRKFQAANGLTPSGKYDAWTLQKLGLGSDTAGKGAPTPPPNTANRLLSSKAQRDEVKNEDQPE